MLLHVAAVHFAALNRLDALKTAQLKIDATQLVAIDRKLNRAKLKLMKIEFTRSRGYVECKQLHIF